MSYQVDYDEDARGEGHALSERADEESRNRSLATLVAGFAALAPPPPAGERTHDLPDLTPAKPADAAEALPSGRIRSALASLSATSASSEEAIDSLRINESYDGLRVLWDVTFAGGGGTVIIITPPRKRDPDGDAVPLAAHVSWRGADAIRSCDVMAFASVLMQAAQKADSLPVAILPEH